MIFSLMGPSFQALIRLFAVFLAGLLLTVPRGAAALERDLVISSTFEISAFPQSGKGAQEDLAASLQVKPDLALTFSDVFQIVAAPRLRLGITDPEYNIFSLDDGYAEYVSETFELRVGYQTFFWGTVESVNIVDILNQRDFVGDFLDPDKLGEPAVRARFLLGEHRFDLYLFSYFTPAPLPGKVNRFSFFDGARDISDDPLYTSGAERLRQQLAVRWDQTIGSADMGLSYPLRLLGDLV